MSRSRPDVASTPLSHRVGSWYGHCKKSHAKPQSREEKIIICPANFVDYSRILDLKDCPLQAKSQTPDIQLSAAMPDSSCHSEPYLYYL
jgi:hypothetical protein